MQVVVPDVEVTGPGPLARRFDPGQIQDLDWGRFLFFSDPDGNGWAVQQLRSRSAG